MEGAWAWKTRSMSAGTEPRRIVAGPAGVGTAVRSGFAFLTHAPLVTVAESVAQHNPLTMDDSVPNDIDLPADHKANELIELLRESRNSYRRQADALKADKDSLLAEVARLRTELVARQVQSPASAENDTVQPGNVQPSSEELVRLRKLDFENKSLDERASRWEAHATLLFGERESLVRKLSESKAAYSMLQKEKDGLEKKIAKMPIATDPLYQANQVLEKKARSLVEDLQMICDRHALEKNAAESKSRTLQKQLRETQAYGEDPVLRQDGLKKRKLSEASNDDPEPKHYAPYPLPSTAGSSSSRHKSYSHSPPSSSAGSTFGLRPVDWGVPPAVRNPYIGGMANGYSRPRNSATSPATERGPSLSTTSAAAPPHRPLSHPAHPPSSSSSHPSMPVRIAPPPRPVPPPPPPADFEACLMCRVTQRVCEPQTGKKSRACKPCAKNKARCSLSAAPSHLMRASDSDSEDDMVRGPPGRTMVTVGPAQMPRHAPPPLPAHLIHQPHFQSAPAPPPPSLKPTLSTAFPLHPRSPCKRWQSTRLLSSHDVHMCIAPSGLAQWVSFCFTPCFQQPNVLSLYTATVLCSSLRSHLFHHIFAAHDLTSTSMPSTVISNCVRPNVLSW
ncbi:hypothetical protein BKA62DRAFT_830938 [Auriculariales sp. MPI-PUGE-AT-0066]|nr:hypothetical protein BKA62DRAFT_830938 [Auriculariales sp. MPI-PUGE-AT-0066]